MGIINCTPDSFYAGSRSSGVDESLMMAEKMLEDGTDLLDLGAYSSRPGANPVNTDQELSRLLPSLEAIVQHFPGAILSVDTFRSEVAKQCLDRGVAVINDISAGLLDPEMLKVVADSNAVYIMMHMRGNPQSMMIDTEYEDLISELLTFFENRISASSEAGIENVIIDPGFGFSKTLNQNYELLRNLDQFQSLDRPVLVGISRKSMIYQLLKKNPEQVLSATSALHLFALQKGADILRVHDVREAKEVIRLVQEISVVDNRDLES
ncbi:dihydropteroate synthase [Crocinitomix catalasitica]|nr:dihydropteroate synthase [Crocinitomix catalasitica]